MLLIVLLAEPIQEFGKTVGDALVDDIVIEGAQLLSDLGLNIAAQLRVGFVWARSSFHLRTGPGWFNVFHVSLAGASFFRSSRPPLRHLSKSPAPAFCSMRSGTFSGLDGSIAIDQHYSIP